MQGHLGSTKASKNSTAESLAQDFMVIPLRRNGLGRIGKFEFRIGQLE